MITKLSPLDARIPPWDFQDLCERHCPLCASTSHRERFVRPDGLVVRCCQRCAGYFVSPAPSESQIQAFYARYDEAHRRSLPATAGQLLRSFRLADPLDDFRIQELLSLMDLRGKACLDVGFGRGYFLHALRALGASPFGVEVDQQAIHYAKEHLGIASVTKGTLFDLDNRMRFDLITMIDFIEHPLEPAPLLERAALLLKPGGLLLVHTPNASFLEGEQPVVFRVDLEHMQYLSLRGCHFLASQHGLEIVHLESYGFPALAGIDCAGTGGRSPSWKNRVKTFFKALPGVEKANRLRRSFHAKPERTGRYHLVCIFRKPEEERTLVPANMTGMEGLLLDRKAAIGPPVPSASPESPQFPLQTCRQAHG